MGEQLPAGDLRLYVLRSRISGANGGPHGASLKFFREGSGDDYVVAGIIGPDNTARAVKDEFAVVNEFEVEEDGYYSVFARNINDHSIKVSFIYYTYN